MTGGQQSSNPHHIQHGQPLLDSITSHRIYHGQDAASLDRTSPAVLHGNAFQDFTFPFTGMEQSHMINLPDVSFNNHMGVEFAQHPALRSNRPSITHHGSVIPGQPNPPNFGLNPSGHVRSSEMVEDDIIGRISPTQHSFEDAGTDEFGLHGSHRADATDLGGKKGDNKSSAPPAWSELKTKAGKDRKRLPLACIACRRKKIRCSGEKPACKHCLRSRIPCVYKVTTRKAAPRTDYMTMLDKRLKRMEDRIIKIIPKSDQEEATSSITRAILKPAILGPSSGNKSTFKKRNAEEAFGAGLESWARAPANFRPPPDDVDDSSSLKDGNISDEDLLFLEGADALPSKEVQEHLAEVFFDNVYGQAYHLLHKPSYMRKLRNDTLPPVLVLSVCAVAARFASQSNIGGTARPFLRGEEWASHARDICTRRYDWPNVTVLTCILILGLHEFGTCHGGRSWALGGQAIRMAFALQLHRDVQFDPSNRGKKSPLSFIDQEIRRRIMWACFLMDRFNSSGSDRPMFIKEESIQIQLPVKESYFQLDIPAETELLDGSRRQLLESHSDGQEAFLGHNMGVAAYTIRAIAIWGRIVTQFHHHGIVKDCRDHIASYANLAQQVDDLQRTLPEPLQYSVDNLNLHMTEKTANQFLLMHLAIQQNVLFLHKAALTWPASNAGEDTHSDFLSQAGAKTVAAANSISDMLRDAEQLKCNVTAPFAGYCAFSATNIHILGIFSSNATAKATAEANAGINIKFLQKMMRYWGMFHWMVEEIRTRYRTAVEASGSGQPCTRESGEWPTLQYADWFDIYPHGITDFDMPEPAAKVLRGERGADAVLEQKPELQSVGEYFTSLTSPSSTEGMTASHGSANKRRQMMTMKSSESLRSSNENNRKISDASMVLSDAGSLRNSGRRATPGQPSVGSQAQAQAQAQTNGSASSLAGYNSVPLSHVRNQPYAPMSPVQASPYSSLGPGQPPFYSQDMLQMNTVDHRGSADLSHNMDSRVSFGYGLSGGQNMMDSGGPNWQAKHVTDNNNSDNNNSNTNTNNKMLTHNQQAIKINSGHPPARHLQSHGPIGADGVVEFNNDVSAGWFLPFNMDPRAYFHDMSMSKEGQASSIGPIDSFHSMFGTNGIEAHHAMDGLRHSL
ncbi:hypothetical protein E4U43_008224 [Claviceps pusilla]|uniref:Zn(2)-C6 fungal-type domain-containing protein n=1 Tax=Claviceps pusilla TaxID=123648 RepID=A0A9P7NB91_9HYPO|nr:hypothetical protein E4U43_008224 [Claviceps pusilla]